MNQQNREFQAIIGHLLDLYRLSKFTFSNPHSYTKFRAIASTKEKVNAKNFIETGTYLGVTTRRCAPHFDRVYTIELDSELAKKASEFLRPKQNVKVLQGDALDILPTILSQDIDDILVFLDGHFSGGVTACGDMPEPAIEEIKILSQSKSKLAGIIIDDFRLFGTEPGFPSKSSLFKAIEEYLPEFAVTVSLDQVIITRQTPVVQQV
jgi:Ribosomal RNA adenine dimethylase